MTPWQASSGSPRTSRVDLRHLAALCVFTIVAIALYGRIDHDAVTGGGWDLDRYRLMAQAAPGLSHAVDAPFAYRLLGPYLAGLLPLPDPTAFYLLSATLGVALAAALYAFLLSEGLDSAIAAFTSALFVLNHGLFGWLIWDCFQLNDLLCLLSLVVMVWALARRRPWLFGAALLLGSLARETSLLMVPVALATLYAPGGPYSKTKPPPKVGREGASEMAAERRRFSLAVLPAIALFFLLRLAVPATAGLAGTSGLAHYLRAPLTFALDHTYVEIWEERLIGSYVPLVTLPLIFLPTTRAYFARRKPLLLFVALVVLSTFWGTDRERLMAPTFIVFYPLVGEIAQRHLANCRGALAAVFAGVIIALPTYRFGRFPLPSLAIETACAMAAVVLVTGAALACKLAHSRPRPRGRNFSRPSHYYH